MGRIRTLLVIVGIAGCLTAGAALGGSLLSTGTATAASSSGGGSTANQQNMPYQFHGAASSPRHPCPHMGGGGSSQQSPGTAAPTPAPSPNTSSY
jgi:hypothetical protein